MARRVAVAWVLALALGASASAQTRSSGTSTGQSSTTTQTPSSSTDTAQETRPATTTFFGDTGLWFVPTAEVLGHGKWSGSVYRRGTNWIQGYTNVADFAGTFAVGIKNRAEIFGSFLVDTGGHDTTAVANRIRDVVGTTATVTDINATRGTIGSSLTAVNLAGLTRIELTFGLVLATAAGALVLTLGLAERRRSFVIAHALGATGRHLRSFVLAEAAILIACGLTAGAVLGAALSRMLVSVLTGVFDPPPTTLTTPAIYLTATALAGIVAIGAVSAATVRLARRSPLTLLGEL